MKFLLPEDADGRASLARIRAAGVEVRNALIRRADWEYNWRAYYRP